MAEEKKELTREEKEKKLMQAKKAGLGLAISGLISGGSGLALDNPGFKEYLEKEAAKNPKKLAEISKKLKIAGAGAGAAGLGIYGLAKYKHHKLKKQDDNSNK